MYLDFLKNKRQFKFNTDFSIIKKNIENLAFKENRMLKISQNWTQTLNKIKTAKEMREKDMEFNNSVLQIKLHKNVIMKHNVS